MPIQDDPYAALGAPAPAQPGEGALLGWLWGALAATVVTVPVMYFLVRPDAAAPVPAPTTTVTVTVTATPSENPTPTPTQKPSPTPSPSQKPKPPARWTTLNVTLETPQDAWAVAELPIEFQGMVARVLSGDDGCTPVIDVMEVHPDGFVWGGEGGGDCGGGARILWGNQSGKWEPLFGMQDILYCEEFERAGVPKGTSSLDCLTEDSVETYY